MVYAVGVERGPNFARSTFVLLTPLVQAYTSNTNCQCQARGASEQQLLMCMHDEIRQDAQRLLFNPQVPGWKEGWVWDGC